ncbi:MAG: hypothetical protein AAFV43_07275 [Planctomycetota bacterium]
MLATSSLSEQDLAGDDLRRIDYLPTPRDIADACRSIRDSWTLSEKRRRFVGELIGDEEDEVLWRPPVVDTSHFRIASRSVEAVA